MWSLISEFINRGAKEPLYLIMEAIFDTAVFILTIIKTLKLHTSGSTSGIVETLARDGVVYYL